MTANVVPLTILSQLKDQTSKPLRTINNNVTKVNKNVRKIPNSFNLVNKAVDTAKNSVSSLVDSVFSLKGAFAAALAAFSVNRLVGESTRAQNALVGLQSVARSTGNDVKTTTDAAKELASDGLISLTQASAGLKNLLAAGLNLEQSIKLFKSLRDAAAFNRSGQLELGEAVEGATQGFKNQLSTLIDNAGVTKNLSVLQRDYAASIGKSVGLLTEAEKTQANYLGIIKEAATFQGDYNRLQNQFSGISSRATQSFRRFLEEIGNIITRNPVVIRQLGEVGTLFKELAKTVRENQKQIQAFIANAINKLPMIFNEITQVLTRVGVALLILNISSIAKAFVFNVSSMKASIVNFGRILRVTLLRSSGSFTILNKSIKLTRTSFALLKATVSLGALLAIDAFVEKIFELIDGFRGLTKPIVAFSKAVEITFLKAIISILEAIDSVIEKFIEANNFISKIPLLGTVGKVGVELNKAFKSGVNRTLDSTKEKLKEVQSGLVDIIQESTKLSKRPLKAEVVVERKVNTNVNTSTELTGFDKVLSAAQKNLSTLTGQFVSFALQGADGAKRAVAAASGAIADVFLPGIGGAVSQIVGLLAEGPDKVRETLREFFKAIPDIIQAIIESLPVLIEELIVGLSDAIVKIAERLDVIIEGLVKGLIKALPRIIKALVLQAPRIAIALAKSMPLVAVELVAALVKEAPRFIDQLIKEITGALGDIGGDILGGAGDLLGGIGDAVGNVVGGIGKAFGFAEGGIGRVKRVPGGFPNDSFPARLTSGELVVDRSTTQELQSFLRRQSFPQANQSDTSGINAALLNRVISLLESPMDVSSSVQFNQREFANILLTLERTNARTA